ncbi:MAG: helix-turn-helix domain-containing protein [Candidatus Caldarchaeum sp.]
MKASPHQLTVVVRNSNCRVVQALFLRGVEGSFKQIRVGEKFSSHLIQLSESVSEPPHIPEATVYTMGRRFIWVDSPSCKACQTLSNNPAIPLNVIFLKGVGVIFTFLTPGRLVSRKIVDEMRMRGLDVDVLSRKVFNLRQVLTPKQQQVLYTAFLMGYFSPARETSLSEIAERLGLSKSTVSRHLRTAMRKLAVIAPQEAV